MRRIVISALIALGGLTVSAHAADITFDTVVAGETSFGFDGDGDAVDDVIFSTTDPLGFNTVGPGASQNYINEPGLEGTALLNPDLRVDFLNGAVDSLAFGFALDSTVEDPGYFASFSVFDASDNLLASSTVEGLFTSFMGGQSSFPEGEVSVSFAGIAAYAIFNFESELGRYIIDNFVGTFGSTEEIIPSAVPLPAALPLFMMGLAGLGFARRRRA